MPALVKGGRHLVAELRVVGFGKETVEAHEDPSCVESASSCPDGCRLRQQFFCLGEMQTFHHPSLQRDDSPPGILGTGKSLDYGARLIDRGARGREDPV